MLFTPLKIYKIPQFTAFSLSHTHTHTHACAHTHTHTHKHNYEIISSNNTFAFNPWMKNSPRKKPSWHCIAPTGTAKNTMPVAAAAATTTTKKSPLPPRALPEFWGQPISCAKYLSSQHGWTEYLFLYFTNWVCSLFSVQLFQRDHVKLVH